MKKLAQDITKYREQYYLGRPAISDVEYDALEEQLRGLDPEHPALLAVGGPGTKNSKKEAHQIPMLSLAKTYLMSELESWRAKRPVMAAWKIDGNSLSLVYQQGRLVMAKTRGDGRYGEVVTEKTRWVDTVPRQLERLSRLEVRGELYCTETSFLQLAEEMVRRGLDRPSSPRNVVAGILGRNEHSDLAKYFSFFAFDLLVLDADVSLLAAGMHTEVEKMNELRRLGFVLPQPQLCETDTEIEAFLIETQKQIQSGDIGIDGAVFTLNDIEEHTRLGMTAHHPRYRMSFKWQGATAHAEIWSIEWDTSRLGSVTPVAVIEPVELSGAKIQNVTLHNAAFVRQYQLKAGDRIEIVRSGEVIPKFLSVIEPSSGQIHIPTQCPSCGHELMDDGVRLICQNRLECPAQKLRSILNWVQTVGIDDLSEKRLQQMIELGLIEDIPDLYRLTQAKLLKMPMFKEKMADKLLRHIEQSRRPALADFLAALGVAGTGKTSWESLLKAFPNLEAIQKATPEEIAQQKGFAEKSAESIASSLALKQELIAALLAVGVEPQAPLTASLGNGPLSLCTFVITGTLSRPRKEIEDLIKDGGGSISSAVSKQTRALICESEESQSSKAKKARELGVEVWSEELLMEALSKGR